MTIYLLEGFLALPVCCSVIVDAGRRANVAVHSIRSSIYVHPRRLQMFFWPSQQCFLVNLYHRHGIVTENSLEAESELSQIQVSLSLSISSAELTIQRHHQALALYLYSKQCK